jgi:nicotinate-nucleotide--dimethylbenzimidazole phosphoribosyltransferase
MCAVLLGLAAEDCVGLGAGADSGMVARKLEVVRTAAARCTDAHGGRPAPGDVLACVGGPEIAVLAGVVLGAAARGAVVVLDGLATSVAALCAVRLEPGVSAYLVAGHRSGERAHGAVLTELGLEPLLDLRLRCGEGVGAVLAAGLLDAARRARGTTARVDR